MSGWEVARLAELESLPGPGTLRWTPVRRHFGLLFRAHAVEQRQRAALQFDHAADHLRLVQFVVHIGGEHRLVFLHEESR